MKHINDDKKSSMIGTLQKSKKEGIKNPLLEVKSLSKHFGGVYAVKDCSFAIHPGTITSIIGPNGAGKTTLFNLVCGIILPDGGKVFFSGKNISGKPTHAIANSGISRTFQQARLFKNLTVRENLLVSKPARNQELKKILQSVHFPLSMDRIAGELSYGQVRLIEIARALLFPHHLLLLDEPTAGVNPKVRQELKGILKTLRRAGKTIVLIEHDMEFVMSISDDVIVMAEGTVLTRGPPEKVQKNKRVLEVYLGK